MFLQKNKKRIFSILALFIFSVFFVQNVQAQTLNEKVLNQLNAGKTSAGYGEAVAPQITVAAIIKILLGFMGSVFIVLIAMASYWLITARGNEQKVEKAMSTIRRAIIGLFVVVLSYAITVFVTSGVQEAVQAPQGIEQPAP